MAKKTVVGSRRPSLASRMTRRYIKRRIRQRAKATAKAKAVRAKSDLEQAKLERAAAGGNKRARRTLRNQYEDKAFAEKTLMDPKLAAQERKTRIQTEAEVQRTRTEWAGKAGVASALSAGATATSSNMGKQIRQGLEEGAREEKDEWESILNQVTGSGSAGTATATSNGAAGLTQGVL